MTAAVFVPVSARKNERQIISWSDIDNSLVQLNQQVLNIQNLDNMYKAYYDLGITDGNWRCHITAHRSLDIPLLLREKLENNVMKLLRVTMEWSYEDVKKHYAQSIRKKIQLDTDAQIVYAQLCVIFLLQNCYNCFRGSNCANFFDLDSSSIHNYLNL